MAIKILAYGDAGQNTGFERVYREILSHLQNTGHYEVVGYGLGYNGNPEFKYPFPVYPAEHRGDYFGFDALPAVCKKHKPDLIWVVQDMWNHLNYVVRKPVDIPYVGYFPVDTPNLKWSHAMAAGGMSQPVAYTAFGATEAAASIRHAVDIMHTGAKGRSLDTTELREWISLPHPETESRLNLRLDYLSRWQNLDQWAIVPHGLDHNTFYPVDKKIARQEFEFGEDEFLVGSINTNQFRKQQDRVMRVFAMLAEKVPEARLVMYCNGNNESGYDLHQAAAYLGISSKCYFVHDFVQELSDESLNLLYNSCDVMINTAGGEGWGLTSMEGAAAGVAQMVPAWSATREVWGPHAMLLPILDWRMEPRHLNTCHALVDVEAAGKQLVEFATNPDVRQRYTNSAKLIANAQPTWAQVGKSFEYILRKTHATFGQPKKMSLEDVVNARKGEVKSELAGAVYMKDGRPVKVSV